MLVFLVAKYRIGRVHSYLVLVVSEVLFSVFLLNLGRSGRFILESMCQVLLWHWRRYSNITITCYSLCVADSQFYDVLILAGEESTAKT
jgi:hypothetical protein